MTTLEIFKEYQRNVKQTEQVRVRIMQGIKDGVPAQQMFMWRCYGLYCATGDKLIYEKAKEYVEATI